MTISKERLAGLIEFAKQTALLKSTPPQHVAQHKSFNRFEEKIKELPGVALNVQEEDFDEVWLRVQRLHESRPPVPQSALLEVWIDLPRSPLQVPTLKPYADRQKLLEMGALQLPDPEEPDKEEAQSSAAALEDFPDKALLQAQLKTYLEEDWSAWAEKEKEVRESITLYSDLFMLSQQLQGNLIDSQLEFVWGIGVALWTLPRGALAYPLLTQLVEISLDDKTMALEIRPRSSEPRLEVDIYTALDNPGVSGLVAAGKKFFETTGGVLNPFEPSTFEELLQSAATFLDASGTYCPTQTAPDDRALPKAGENLIITDTWALFARPRTNNLLVQDLQRFEQYLAADEQGKLPPAVLALVTEPSATHEEAVLPSFRGLSTVEGSGGSGNGEASELYFPKAYNDEQVQIVQMLEAHDGVVVQGPPGTGKTHTIANVICHYLAQGKRVLVTSMKDPALAVLQEKLPESIRPLAISLLTSEAEGMKQFEFAIHKIAAEITRIDRIAYRQEIEQIDGQIDFLHSQIAKADKDIAGWARKNLDTFQMDGETLTPLEAAQEVAVKREAAAWFPDVLTLDSRHRPQFGDGEISALREARRALGSHLAYLGKKIPQIEDFPETAKLLQVHQDLSRLSELKAQEAEGAVPSLADASPATVQAAIPTAAKVANLRSLIQDIENAQQAWTAGLQQSLRQRSKNEILDLFLMLKDEILDTLESRKRFLSRPVTLPENFDSNLELVEAVAYLAQGKKPFGLAGLFGKTEQKRLLDAVVVVSLKPSSQGDWEHVLSFITFQQQSRSLMVRWNALADEISLPLFEARPERLSAVGSIVDLFNKVAQSISEEAEIAQAIQALLPDWEKAGETPYTRELLGEVEGILNHHLMRHRLAETWVVKESFLKALAGCEGGITQQFRDFLDHRLGNPEITEAETQAEWSRLMEELRKVHGLSAHLKTVSEITGLIEASGAQHWAEQLRSEPHPGAYDPLLPANWREVWRLCRLIHFVDSIDGRKELKRLSNLRMDMEGDLSKQYQEAVTKRTWLKLSENATHDVRAALEAYRSAIKKIGKGKGIRAGRYRQDARFAAERANGAIPCWIMPHYRICESLPASFGCFDLVVIDEASQSDLTALPAILRAQKVLVVGDDKQVSPEGVGLEEEKIRNLMGRFLAKQVDIYRPQMTPERSIYDLFKVVFAKSAVMLREHFRCVAPIIEYSKREFYNHELKPLRLPTASERLDPPLVDVHVTDGHRNNEVNRPEARFIVDEIKSIVQNPELSGRTIGVVSLLGNEQALLIMHMLNEELGEQVVTQYKITCGDARTFQGKERDIMFLSMVASPGQAHAQTQDMVAQRFNVAASRARDRMYLVRSVRLEDLSQADHLRARLIRHFQSPFLQNEASLDNLREHCESPFEREVFDLLVERGYRVIPQVSVGAYRIDLVVEGEGDSRLAIECDGDRYHGPEQWDSDMRRQRTLERAGWRFWRCFASTFILHREDVLRDLLETLEAHGVQPTGLKTPVTSIYVESRQVMAYPPADLPDENRPEPDKGYALSGEEAESA
jgi:very-short-patch-repair endonuclease/phosphopantetheinyl transferase (holo-ACP synthase)